MSERGDTYEYPVLVEGLRNSFGTHVIHENLDLKVVLHGDGLALLLYPDAKDHTKMQMANATDEMQARIAGLKQQGVQFQVCANTLKGRKIDAKQDLYDVADADVVPSGVAQLGILQSQGYAYIKP